MPENCLEIWIWFERVMPSTLFDLPDSIWLEARLSDSIVPVFSDCFGLLVLRFFEWGRFPLDLRWPDHEFRLLLLTRLMN